MHPLSVRARIVSQLLLVAASGLAREVLALVRACGSHDVIGLLDDAAPSGLTAVDGSPVLGTLDDAGCYPGVQLLVCIGSGQGRRRAVERLYELGIRAEQYATIVDPSVRIPANSTVGPGSILLAGVVLTTSVTIGCHVVAMPQVTLTHDDVVEDYATLAAGVCLGGNVRVGNSAYLGMNSSVRQGLRIGQGATLGMAAALLEDLPAHETWAGVPARVIHTGLAQRSASPTVVEAS